MARFHDRERALALRKEGYSYSQIKKVLGVSKSTLSLWLQGYPLSKERIRELRDRNEQRIERFRETMRRKREQRLLEIYKREKRSLFPLRQRDLFIAGLFLYWGEGTKYRTNLLFLSNTDPAIIRFFVRWLIHSLHVPTKKMKARLQLYNDMDARKELVWWSRQIQIPVVQFGRSYIKKTTSTRINHKGSFGHGTCTIGINDVLLAEKIFMNLKAVADYYGDSTRT